MSKKKKEKSKKSGKKNPDKKAVKKAAKSSPKKNAAKNTSKPAKTKKAKPVATPARSATKKMIGKAAKPVKSAKKAQVKASHPKTAVKVISKNTKPKKALANAGAMKSGPKKAEVKKVVSKKKEIKSPVKASKPVTKPAKPVAKKEVKSVKKELKPVVKSSAAKAPAKPAPVVKKVAAVPPAKKAEETVPKKQIAERKANDVLAITNTIPVATKNEISLSKIASISHSITNPIKKTDSYAVKPEKEPNGKFELEFVVHSSAEMLYEFLSTPSGLSEWFCDDLNIRNGIYTFIWDDQLQQARLLKTVDLQLVRFQWVDKTDGSYFEFRIQRDDLTNDISLIITDFAESVGDRESSKLLWHSQVEKLMHVIGSIF